MRKLIVMAMVGGGLFLYSGTVLAQDDTSEGSAATGTETNVVPPGMVLPPLPASPAETNVQPSTPSPTTPPPQVPAASAQAPAAPSAAVAPTPAPEPAKPPAAPVAPAPAPAAPPKETVGIIDFQGTPLQAVLEYYSHLTKRSIISAPNLAGVIYFRSQTDLTRDEAIQALDSVLAINGIAALPLGEKFLKVVQIATAKQEGLNVEPELRTLPPADSLLTQIIPLKFAEVNDIVGAIQPYMHAYGQLIPLQKSNALLITDTGANINQMLEIVKYVDQPSALRMQTKVYILQHAKAGDVVQRLQGIIQETQQMGARASAPSQPTQQPGIRLPPRPGQPAAPAGTAGATEESVVEGKVILTADERTNKMFILSRPSNFDFFDKLIAELDAKVDPDVIIKVVELQYATAEDAASLVNALITGGTLTVRRTGGSTPSGGRTTTSQPPPPPTPVAVGGGAGGAGGEGGGFLQFAQGVRILPDPRTNALLIMATREDMKRIEALIKSIDTSVAQVQIEVVIAEVTLGNELDVGVNVFKRLFQERSISQTGGSSTDGNAPIQLPKASDLASAIASNLPSAAALAAGPGGLTYFATFHNLKLDAILHALASTSKGKVLSTPVIQTMDNQEASIIVGSSVPVPVSTVSSLVSGIGTLATGQLNANIEYKDVAIELKVTPRINPDGYVRMEIEQKVNDLGRNVTISGTTVPEINKREAKSSVAVQDQSTIVLGGLIKETKTVTETKVPFLGDIPLLGHLFKSKNNGKTRDELIVFIRPTVMRTDAQAVAEAHRRARLLRAGDELELERRFESAVPGASSSELTNEVPGTATEPVAPADQSQQPTTETGPTNEELDRYGAKVKALQEQAQPPSN